MFVHVLHITGSNTVVESSSNVEVGSDVILFLRDIVYLLLFSPLPSSPGVSIRRQKSLRSFQSCVTKLRLYSWQDAGPGSNGMVSQWDS